RATMGRARAAKDAGESRPRRHMRCEHRAVGAYAAPDGGAGARLYLERLDAEPVFDATSHRRGAMCAIRRSREARSSRSPAWTKTAIRSVAARTGRPCTDTVPAVIQASRPGTTSALSSST